MLGGPRIHPHRQLVAERRSEAGVRAVLGASNPTANWWRRGERGVCAGRGAVIRWIITLIFCP